MCNEECQSIDLIGFQGLKEVLHQPEGQVREIMS